MKTQSALLLFQYWNRLRDTSAAPCRTRIEPYDIREVLSQTFILEAPRNATDMSFRLAGTAIGSLFGRPLRGEFLRSLFNEAQRPIVCRLTRNCFQEQSVVLLGLDAATRTGRKSVLEVLMLPLQDEKEGHRILGCIVPQAKQFWHGLDPITNIELQSIRIVDPSREPLFLANRPEIAITPALAPEEKQLQLARENVHNRGVKLMVIQGGKQQNNPSP